MLLRREGFFFLCYICGGEDILHRLGDLRTNAVTLNQSDGVFSLFRNRGQCQLGLWNWYVRMSSCRARRGGIGIKEKSWLDGNSVHLDPSVP
mgnify:CR=1 FL=1